MLLYRCPTSHGSADLADAFFAYGLLESGLWPADGGLCDQSASFVAFVREVNAERASIERRNNEHREAVRKAMGS